MKMKIAAIAVLAIAFVSAVMISPIHASYAPIVYAWTDKPSYLPGDAGVLHITVRNQGTQAFTVKNITVAYPWKSFIIDHWDGNFTTAGIPGNRDWAELQHPILLHSPHRRTSKRIHLLGIDQHRDGHRDNRV